MTYEGGLPYEECRRAQRLSPRRDRAPLSPGFGVPPFHPAHPPGPVPPAGTRRRSRTRPYVRLDGAALSGLLTVLSVATLLVTITVAL
ncbi:hypothetical protein LZP81_29400 [Streptomyces parvulus]|uniref:hypothetical protein n=1 Tax=Streptomyces parvulus TaxID=146923 RepID=UPI001E40E8D3|nr:hypothetical protein [Streptomyces parvulus]MCC9158081.1 hypothetical protein [Streptomyces parvulus]MCE7690978.1 hypothetical protein [Streptomyces parvulus]